MTVLSNLLALLSLDDSAYLEALNSSKTATNSFTDNLSKVGGSVVVGALTAAGAAVTAVGGFLASSIGPASDLGETINKTSVVFGDSAEAILAWGETAATTMGMTKNSALGAAATYGNLFRAMNISEESSAAMSTSLVELAGDLASFNNMDPTEVLDKLRAGISGESEPLKQLGVNINETLLKQRAMEMGLYDGVGALDAASKAQAAYSLIMEQTQLAQGDFARTSDGLANQQRILAARFEDIRAKVGTALLPVMTKLATTLSEYLSRPEVIAFIERFTQGVGNLAQRVMESLPGVISWLQNAFWFLQQNEGIVIGIFAALGVAVTAWAVTTAAAAWTAMAPFLPVIAVLVAIAAAVYLLYQAWQNNWGGMRDTIMGVWASLQPTFEALKAWLGVAIPVALQWLSNLWTGTLLPALQAVWGFISTYVLPLLGAIGQVIGAVIMNAVKQWSAFLTNILVPALRTFWEWIEQNILPTLQKFAAWVAEKVQPALEGIGQVISDVIGWLGGLADSINNLELPDWLTPGSPTPWEIGLWGVGDALKNLARTEMPAFRSSLELQAEPLEVGSGKWEVGGGQRSAISGAGGGGGMVFNINVTSDGITDERDVARKIASAVEVILRERGLA